MTDYDIDAESRVMGLSIDEFDGKEWFKQRSTQYELEMDARPAEEGGGGQFYEKWRVVMGCWLNLMRGHLNALSLSNDPDRANFYQLTAKNQSLGIDPEGLAYDYDIVRRPLTSLVYTYKRKGSCPGIVEVVRMFTKWDAECREFGTNDCLDGASNLRLWDGVAPLEYGLETADEITSVVISATGVGLFMDLYKSWADDIWSKGSIRGAIGDVVCIDFNADTNQVTTLALKEVTSLTVAGLVGDTSLTVASGTQLYIGLEVQVTSATETSPGSGVYAAEIVEIASVPSAGEVNIRPKLKNAYPIGSQVTIQKSVVRDEYLSDDTTSTLSLTGNTLTDSTAKWTENQWAGYALLTSANVLRNIVSNTGTVITFDGAPVGASSPTQVSIAYDFIVGGSFATRKALLRYKIYTAPHSFLFEPTLDLELRGSLYDPFNRLYGGGSGLPLGGVYGPNDVGVYILTDVAAVKGKSTTGYGPTFLLDPSQPAPADDALVGMFLNPNQNQEQVFEILANTPTTLTVAGDISSLLFPGQAYYVLRPRDKVRFQRLSSRLRNEFTSDETRTHLLFL